MTKKFCTGATSDISDQFAAHACTLHRIVRVQRNVWLVRAEFLAMVGHVHASIRGRTCDHWVSEKPVTHPVVCVSVLEQQSMRSFVHQRSELGMHAAHEKKCDDPNNRMIDAQRNGDDCNVLCVHPHNSECVAQGRNAAKICADIGECPSVGCNKSVVDDMRQNRRVECHATEAKCAATSHERPIRPGVGVRWRSWCRRRGQEEQLCCRGK